MLRPEEYLRDYTKAVEVWALSNIYSGTNAPASFNSAYDGEQFNLILQNDNIDVDCDDRLAPFFDGTAHVSLPHQALCDNNVFNVLEGGVFAIAKVHDSSVWNDTVRRRIFVANQNPGSLVHIIKSETGDLWFQWNGDGVLYNSPFFPADFTDTFSVAVTWSQTQDFVKFYINGQKVDEIDYRGWYLYNGHPSGFGLRDIEIGCNRTGGTNHNPILHWVGDIAYTALFAVDVPTEEMVEKTHNALVG